MKKRLFVQKLLKEGDIHINNDTYKNAYHNPHL
jgi:ribosomal 50S subunit-recycling heat shock protein